MAADTRPDWGSRPEFVTAGLLEALARVEAADAQAAALRLRRARADPLGAAAASPASERSHDSSGTEQGYETVELVGGALRRESAAAGERVQRCCGALARRAPAFAAELHRAAAAAADSETASAVPCASAQQQSLVALLHEAPRTLLQLPQRLAAARQGSRLRSDSAEMHIDDGAVARIDVALGKLRSRVEALRQLRRALAELHAARARQLE